MTPSSEAEDLEPVEGLQEAFGPQDYVEDVPSASLDLSNFVAFTDPAAGATIAEHFDADEIVEDIDQAPLLGNTYKTRDAEEHDQDTRRSVTLALLGLLLVLMVGAGLLLSLQHATAAQTAEFAEHLFGPLVALTGTAIGFYFSGERNRRR